MNDPRSNRDVAPSSGPEPEMGYATALRELDVILRELEDTDVDVDHLADQVRRAAELIALCRDRIDGARTRIDAVIADLDAASPPDRESGEAGFVEPA